MKFEELASKAIGQPVARLEKKFGKNGETLYDLFDEDDKLIKTISRTNIMMYVEHSPCAIEFNKPWDDPDFINTTIGGKYYGDE